MTMPKVIFLGFYYGRNDRIRNDSIFYEAGTAPHFSMEESLCIYISIPAASKRIPIRIMA